MTPNKIPTDNEEFLTNAQLCRKYADKHHISYKDSRYWIKEESPPFAWTHERVLELMGTARAAGRAEGREEQLNKIHKFVERRALNLRANGFDTEGTEAAIIGLHIRKMIEAIRTQTTDKEEK